MNYDSISNDSRADLSSHISLQIQKSTDAFDSFISKAQLHPKLYQREGLQFCLSREIQADLLDVVPGADYSHAPRGGIVADEMGLGKTIMMIGLVVSHFKLRTLIVLPVPLVQQWVQQFIRTTGHSPLLFTGQHKYRITTQQLLDAPIVITTYGHISRRALSTSSHESSSRTSLLLYKPHRVIFDEAHHLRNHNTSLFQGAIHLVRRLPNISYSLPPPIVWIVTGTPIQNSFADLKTLASLFGVSFPHHRSSDFTSYLQQFSRDFILRRTKLSVGLSLPPIHTHTVSIPWNDIHERHLSQAIHYAIPFSRSFEKLSLYIRARQMCTLPNMIDPEIAFTYSTILHNSTLEHSHDLDSITREIDISSGDDSSDYDYDYDSHSISHQDIQLHIQHAINGISKLNAVASRISTSHKSLVFCHYRREMHFLKHAILRIHPDISVDVIHGGVSLSERERILELAPQVIILQIQTCSEGLNLQLYNHVHFVSPHWNPSIEDQAIARAHRFGQTQDVHVFRYYMQDILSASSIDSISSAVQHSKRDIIQLYIPIPVA